MATFCRRRSARVLANPHLRGPFSVLVYQDTNEFSCTDNVAGSIPQASPLGSFSPVHPWCRVIYHVVLYSLFRSGYGDGAAHTAQYCRYVPNVRTGRIKKKNSKTLCRSHPGAGKKGSSANLRGRFMVVHDDTCPMYMLVSKRGVWSHCWFLTIEACVQITLAVAFFLQSFLHSPAASGGWR